MIERGYKAPEPTIILVEGSPFLSFQGLLDAPAFPGRKTKLFTIKVGTPESAQYVIYYRLSTAHGLFPKPSRIKRGAVSDWGMITFDW